ncbi:Isoprenylcysteine carboxyl methyltransferase family-domain-containing protein [Xylaria digitata]|nr:Isoprenylcysteine carboxyl methyltransferase family-domain-containing protein [Xylaria digitata]
MSTDDSKSLPSTLSTVTTVLTTSPVSSPRTPFFSPLPTLNENPDDEKPWATRHRRRRSLVVDALAPITIRSSAINADDVLPRHSPGAPNAQTKPDQVYFPGQPKSLEGIAIRSFYLGIALALSFATMVSILLLTASPLWRVPFFIGALSTFHFLEFWTTARYNTSVAKIDSFLLTANWPAYAIAHMAASLECLLTKLLFPNRAWAPFYSGHILLLVGFILVFLGQATRSLAMAQAGPSFNHTIQRKKKDDHDLVTTGVYSFLRHPSYFGFFYWGVGTQVVLGNPICFVGYMMVLWRFFASRIRSEESDLVRFFGDDYTDYKKRVGTGIPFIR